MSQHDFDIANQTAPNTRADLNLALKALASNSSGVSAPTTTYANMIYYNTSTNILYKRNEADSAWIALGTVDESLGIFTASGATTLASEAEALAGTNNTKIMTPLRVKEVIDANSFGAEQIWQDFTASRLSLTYYQNTTGRAISVSITYSSEASSPGLSVSQDGSTLLRVCKGGPGVSGSFNTIVPNNWYYRATGFPVIGSITGWFELR